MNLTLSERLVDEILAQQRAKGRAKYGKGLDFRDSDAWGIEALEELADAVQYLAAEVLRWRERAWGYGFLPERWDPEHGPALWWRLPVSEPPWVGTPLDDDWPGDGYFQAWQRIPDRGPSLPIKEVKDGGHERKA